MRAAAGDRVRKVVWAWDRGHIARGAGWTVGRPAVFFRAIDGGGFPFLKMWSLARSEFRRQLCPPSGLPAKPALLAGRGFSFGVERTVR